MDLSLSLSLSLSPPVTDLTASSDGLKELKNPEFSGFLFLTASHMMSGYLGEVLVFLLVSTRGPALRYQQMLTDSPVSLAKARARHQLARQQLADGGDPSITKQASTKTFE